MRTSVIDPTYLRTIIDGLSSGALQKENPSALPEGLVGVYEEAIPPVSQVNERKKFLEFFGVWALMKKEVSVEFVVSLLDGWSEEHVLAYIGRYSKWFNSSVSGLYTLYHERFRAFVLQKISGSQLRDINNWVIMACNDALTRRLNDEWERYALEYLSAHLLQPTLDTKERGSELQALAYNTNHWNRQIEVSKGFDWSKRLLNDMMLWASKYDDDQVIECALNKVDLHHMEQNDAPRIVDLVAQNDIETALQRIESFGGNDKEGLQRKFILYMLCLMELTMLDSRDKSFRKAAIEQLLKHLDDNLPVNHAVLNWNEFMPHSFINGIIQFLSENNINEEPLSMRSRHDLNSRSSQNTTETKKSNSNDLQYRNELILSSLENLDLEFATKSAYKNQEDIEEKARNCFDIVFNHLSNDEYEEANSKVYNAFNYSNQIPGDDMWGSYGNHLVGNFAEQIVEIGFHRMGIQIFAKMERGEGWTELASDSISKKLFEEGDLKNLELIYFELRKNGITPCVSNAFKCLIDYHYSNGEFYKLKYRLIAHLKFNSKSIDYFKQLSFFNELIYARPYLKTFKLLLQSDIPKRNSKGERLIEVIIDSYTDEYGVENLGNQIIDVINLITRHELKAEFVKKYVKEIIRLNEGVEFVLQNGSFDEDFEIESYFEEIFSVLCDFTGYNEAIGLISKIDDRGRCRIDAAQGILKAYFVNERQSDDITFNNYQDICQSILATWKNEKTKDRMLSNLLEVLLEYSKIKEYLTLVDLIKDNNIKYTVLSRLLKYLYKENYLDLSENVLIESLQCARLILDETIRCKALIEISNAQRNQGNFEAATSVLAEALEYAIEITDNEIKFRPLIEIANEFSKQGDKIIALTLIQDAIESANAIVDESKRDSTLNVISSILIENGEIYKALECAKLIKAKKYISWLIHRISNEFARQGSFDDAFTCTRQISDINEKCGAFKVISVELFRHGKIHESFQCARGIEREYWKSESLKFISIELFNKGDLKEAKSLLLEALEYARLVKDDSDKSRLLVSISNEFTRQGMLTDAMECLVGLYDEISMIQAINKVLNYLCLKGDLIQGERFGDKISNGYLRNIYFKEISKYLIDSLGSSNFLEQYKKIESIELRKIILTYWVENIEIKELKINLLCHLIYLSQNEIEILEKSLQLFALNQIFYNEIDSSRFAKFDAVLNVQWAINLKRELI